MFVHYRSQGIILKKVDRKEADQLFIIYTKDFGKLRVLGRSIRKISSKLRSGIELFYLSEIEFIQGKTQKTLTDAILIKKFKNLRHNLEKLNAAIKISEVLDDLIKGEEKDDRVWNLLIEVFQKLNQTSFQNKNTKLIYYYFLWNLFSILGYRPELYHCSICQKKLKPENLYFNQKEVGIICQSCFSKENSGKKIDIDIIKILRVILDKSEKNIYKLKLEDKHLNLLGNVSKSYLSFLLERGD